MIQATKQLAQSAIDQSDQAQQMMVNNCNQPIITLCSSLCEVLYGSWPFCRAQGSCWTDDWTSHCLGIPRGVCHPRVPMRFSTFCYFLLLSTGSPPTMRAEKGPPASTPMQLQVSTLPRRARCRFTEISRPKGGKGWTCMAGWCMEWLITGTLIIISNWWSHYTTSNIIKPHLSNG